MFGAFVKSLVKDSDFQIEETPIAESQSGIVFKATRIAKPRKPKLLCAIKRFTNIKTNDDQRNFHIQISLCSSLHHVTILPFVGYEMPYLGEGYYTIVTEFMPNGTLRDFLNKVETGSKPENFELIRSIIIFGITAGMAIIHQKEIYHRNLKPENVFLDESLHPKIGDFALSKNVRNEENNRMCMKLKVGTPLYMAPEMFTDPHYDNKIDVFSYSILLYELLTLRKPYSDIQGIDLSNIESFVSKGERPTIKKNEIPGVYEELLKSCWQSNAYKRPSFIEIIKKFIEHKNEFFNVKQDDKKEFEDYIELAKKDLQF